MSSIPIARSILRQRQAISGNRVGCKPMPSWEVPWNSQRRGAKNVATSCRVSSREPHATLHATAVGFLGCELVLLERMGAFGSNNRS
jgi:hypothetical protein